MMEIKIRKRSQPEWLLWIIFILPFCFGCFIGLLHFPNAVKYILDFVWAFLLLLTCANRKRYFYRINSKLLGWTIAFGVYTVILLFFRYQSLFYFLWGARNNYRFYVLFFALMMFLSEKSANTFLKYFDCFFWANAIISVIQYVFLGLKGDNLGGIFGSETGVNQYTLNLLIIAVTKTLLLYLHKQKKLSSVIWIFLISSVIAAVAEVKFFFVVAAAVGVVSVLITNFSWRKVWIILAGVVILFWGANLLDKLFAKGDNTTMSIDFLLETVTSDRGYTASGDLNRLTAIAQINDGLFEQMGQRLFGLGLGNCDVSSFDLFNTPFYDRNSHMHYTWFSVSMMYLETGYIGLTFFFGFFITCFYQAYKRLKEKNSNVIFCQMGMIISIVCCLIAFYNASLRAEAGYMMYFVLALPFIKGDNLKENA